GLVGAGAELIGSVVRKGVPFLAMLRRRESTQSTSRNLRPTPNEEDAPCALSTPTFREERLLSRSFWVRQPPPPFPVSAQRWRLPTRVSPPPAAGNRISSSLKRLQPRVEPRPSTGFRRFCTTASI